MKSQNAMKEALLMAAILVALTFTFQVSALGQKLVTPGYLFNSDPTCREMNGQFYLFTTQDPFTVQFERPNQFYKGMYAFRAFSTTDFDQDRKSTRLNSSH